MANFSKLALFSFGIQTGKYRIPTPHRLNISPSNTSRRTVVCASSRGPILRLLRVAWIRFNEHSFLIFGREQPWGSAFLVGPGTSPSPIEWSLNNMGSATGFLLTLCMWSIIL